MSRAGDIEYQAQKIQKSTTAFEFAEGLHGKAGMHSFFMEESMGLTTSQF